MFIDAFTCCVGPVYASYLKRSLPVWMDTLDSLTVVTKPDDADTLAACKPYTRLRVVTSELFHAFGADFNKGAALCQAYAAMDPMDGALHFDSDIMPDRGWRKVAEKQFRPGGIYGALRYNEDGSLIRDDGPWPYGYFQLWHAADPAVQFWPLLEPWHPHCGSYDLEFLEKWPKRQWKKLDFKVTHFGEVRRNWFGVGLPPEQQAEAFKKMDAVHRVGLRNTRMKAREKVKVLAVPPPAIDVSLEGDDAWNRQMVRACMTDDPFLVRAAARRSDKVERLRPGNASPQAFRERVEKALAEKRSKA